MGFFINKIYLKRLIGIFRIFKKNIGQKHTKEKNTRE